MLDKLAAFFRNLFSGLFGGKKSDDKPKTDPVEKPITDTTSDKPITTTKPKEELPPVDPEAPQDAPEVDKDTASTVVTINENDPVVLEPGDDPASVETEEDAPTDPDDTDIESEEEDPPVVEQPKHKARYMWCLDNGHGKKTAGKRSPKFEDGQQFLEYEFNRDIVNRIIIQLDKIGVKYFNVVPEIDVDNILEERVARANNKKSNFPKIFLSIHSNAFGRSGWETPSGIETWYFHNSRSGRAIASVFQKHLIDALGWNNRRLKSYPGKKQFYVLRNTRMPAVLTENGFYTNKAEARLLMKDNIRQDIAEAHVKAILEIEKNGIG